jgi:hypothetical protein
VRVTVTAGTGSCNHITIKDAATGAVLFHATLAELRQESREGDPLLMQMRQVIKEAGATTRAQAKAAVEAAEFI